MGVALAPTGYSGTPLATKLGLKDDMRIGFIALPEALSDLARAAEFHTVQHLADWASLAASRENFDVILAFTKQRLEIEDHLPALQDSIKRDGMIWVSWPKKVSKVPTDVTEDVVRNAALKLDLVDVKVCAVDEIWSGLKLVIRKDRR